MKRMRFCLFLIAAAFLTCPTFLQAQDAGRATGAASLSATFGGDAEDNSTELNSGIDVSWEKFEEVDNITRRAQITSAAMKNILFETETSDDGESRIDIVEETTGRYRVYVCHVVRICRWYCGWCCVPKYYLVCFRATSLIDDWKSGTRLTLELEKDVAFEDEERNTITVLAGSSTLDFVIP